MIMIAYFGFQNGCLQTRSRQREKQRRTRAAQQREPSVRCASQRKPSMQIWRSETAMELTDREPAGIRRARTSPPPQYRDDPLLRSGVTGLCGNSTSAPNCSSIRASRPTAIVGPSLASGRVFPRDPKQSRSVLRSRVKRVASARSFDSGRRVAAVSFRHLETGCFGFYDGSVGRATKEGRDIENVFLDRIAHTRGAAVRLEALRSRMARIFRPPFGVAGRRTERRTL